MYVDEFFSSIGLDSQDLLLTSRQIFDKEAARIIAEQKEAMDRLYALLFKRAGITDPYLRGTNKTRQALESGEFPMKDSGQYFDDDIRDLKAHLNETNREITDWAIHRTPPPAQDRTDSSPSSEVS